MIDVQTLLIDSERVLGRYTIVVLRPDSRERWSPSVMQLDAAVTNYRLLLRPYRKKYAPASLPARYVTAFQETRVDGYNCLQLELKTGHYLYLMLSTGKPSDFYDDLGAMTAPPPRFQFDKRVTSDEIRRLIEYFDLSKTQEIEPINTTATET